MKIKLLVSFFFTLVCTVLIVIPIWTEFNIFNKTIADPGDSIIFEIPRNSTISDIYRILSESGFDISEFEFKLTAKWYGKDSKIRYGRFILPPSGPVILKDFIDFLTMNGVLTKNITIPEGSRIIEIAHILKTQMSIDSTKFVEKTREPALLVRYNIEAASLEGYLYPETYNFNENEKTEDIIGKMYSMYRLKTEVLRAKMDSVKLSEHQILTLASIIQGEVMHHSEFRDVSAVYNNRLKKGMLLQADPTIQYLFSKPKRLLNIHIDIDSPYNTYKYAGLPPGPINNPSIDAIKAALYPADKPYIYMVAKGDGTHYFNTSLADHLEDKKKLDELRRNQRRKKRGK